MTMREKIARALYEKAAFAPWGSWDEALPSAKAGWLSSADTVLDAIREPDEAMLAAGNLIVQRGGLFSASSVWCPMVNAASGGREEFACPRCGGMGWVQKGATGQPGTTYQNCPACDATGILYKDAEQFRADTRTRRGRHGECVRHLRPYPCSDCEQEAQWAAERTRARDTQPKAGEEANDANA